MADSSRVQVRYVKESTWGTTPASALKNFRATSANLKQVHDTVVSEELRSDGQVADLITVGVRATAQLGFEWSFGALDDFLEGALRSTWQANTGFDGSQQGVDLLANGTALTSFTVEGEFSDIGKFIALTGCRIGQLTLQGRVGDIVQGTIDFTGKVAAVSDSTTGTGEPTAAPTKDVTDPINVTGLKEGGNEIELISVELTINNNPRPRQVLGTAALAGVGLGRFVVTGAIEAYFEDSALLSKYLSRNDSSLEFTFADNDGNETIFRVDRIKYTDADLPVQGNDQDVTIRLPFQGLVSPSTGKTLRIVRAAA